VPLLNVKETNVRLIRQNKLDKTGAARLTKIYYLATTGLDNQSIILQTTAAIKQGDQFIFEQVFNEYHEKLYFYIISKTHSAYLAEEVTQLTFIKLWQYRNSLNEKLPISAQIFRTAKTTLIDLLRKHGNNNRLVIEVSQKDSVFPINEAEGKMGEKELKQRLHHAISKLPPVRRKVFEMNRINGMSYKEIAAELSLSVKTVENHIANAIKQLRRILTPFLLFILELLHR